MTTRLAYFAITRAIFIFSNLLLSSHSHVQLAPSGPSPPKPRATSSIFSLSDRIALTNPTRFQIRAVAALGGVAIDLPERYVHHEDNKKPEFLAKFPHGKIPTWEGKDGFLLFEGALIARYILNINTAACTALPNLLRHMHTVFHQPALAHLFEPTPELAKAPVHVAPKNEKEAKPTPKAEKKPKPKAEEDDDDNGVLEEPKAKNPLDDLPKSTLNPEDWKHAYSNKETCGASGALEWFYEHYDAAGFSLWRVDFKYPEELTQTFMSSNQIGGFNRLEAARKYLFGSVGVLGAANDSLIAGAGRRRSPSSAARENEKASRLRIIIVQFVCIRADV
ncbi:hypothetical protein B0H17DRAFT_1326766 [Mycena rosella]|uniref:EF-1-gamma C-terminal domain-containing protein n=1 Tax=Mycena rosella TaxID=1033263 RepID=A0AAD7GS69_MYCRO|nr:hypothetical protein B0H17DRAFT_1326766 [Mycena rosella]